MTDHDQPKTPDPTGEIEGLDPRELMARGLRSTQAASSPSPPWEPPAIDDLAALFPRFEIIELLGRGGMGAVYKARQRELDRLVAIKIMPPQTGDSSNDPAFAERFTREARALASLNHPNIVAVHDSGCSGDIYWLVMEYVDGVNLRATIQTGEIAPAEALAIVPQICAALQYAHDEGIVHRDIKPENILLTKSGQVKIADFGLVKLLGATGPDFTLTAPSQTLGTLRYMAPEQMEGSPDIDHRADIYSLGIVFYELLTGEIPMGRFDPPSQKVQIDVALDEVVLRTLEREPDRRYQRAGEIKTDIESITSRPGTPAATAATPGPDTAASEAPRFSRAAILGAAWAPFVFLAAIPALVLVPAPDGGGVGISLLGLVLLIFFGIPGLSAPIGTTALGLVSISHIRHSNGRLVGLPLALADALLFPLLILDVLIVFLCYLVIMSADSLFDIHMSTDPINKPLAYATILGIISSSVVDFFIIRAAWRAAARGTSYQRENKPAPPPEPLKPWEKRWLDQPKHIRKPIEFVMMLACTFFMILFISYESGGGFKVSASGEEVRHRTTTIGAFDPWWDYDMVSGGGGTFNINIFSWSSLFGIIFLVLCRALLAMGRAEKRGRALEEAVE